MRDTLAEASDLITEINNLLDNAREPARAMNSKLLKLVAEIEVELANRVVASTDLEILEARELDKES